MAHPALPATIRTERLRLARAETSAAEEFLAAMNEPSARARLADSMPWVAGLATGEEARDCLTQFAALWDERSQFDFLIRDREGLVGGVGAHSLSWEHGRAELGFWLLERGEGRGFATEAVRALTGELFAIGFHRVEIHCAAGNTRSVAVPRRAGFTLDGTMREALRDGGRFEDLQIWGKLVALSDPERVR